ncbi:MAG: SDR family oxidoreductase [Gammaproteobacteria bacterium]|nr:SDR family oxidoreductase [Gammaproteobacteria bacterium]NNF50186.1 NAD-dependent epimerase/dehydratase family protein [Woeseiaceae bacterium]MBT8094489.1 SDR family oxidoreductase [Gammaproteobacteria bacterium]MBT8104479.1 SDR family oxidoreductase [Gammaproteobacteria bacterium]NNK24493.1 NAD-dependent epimerase/dehydratase family protein [Woeseiaceae bacterium]
MQEQPSNSETDRRNGRDIVLTGATGFVGKVVLYELLRRREELGVEKVRLLIRAGRNSDATRRLQTEIASSRCFEDLDFDWQEYVEPIESDLSLPSVGVDEDTLAAMQESVTHVINCAASVQFDLPIEQAAKANVTTALEMLELARGCRNLERFLSVSTAYVTPHTSEHDPVHEVLAPLPRDARELYEAIQQGLIDENKLMAQSGHPNTYTLTKCIAEHLLVERQGDVPLAIVRPSIISASMERPSPGWIDSPAAFALFVVQIGAGRMRAVIARPESSLDVIPCDAVVDRVIDVAFGKGPPQEADAPLIRHAVAGPENSPMIRDCIRAITEFFAQNPDTRRGNKDQAASVRYLGPDGLLYRLNHWLYHERGSKSRRKAEGIAATNRLFSVFTQKTFQFESSMPFDPPDFDTSAYIATVCKGVAENLMGADQTAVPFAGSRFPRTRPDSRWVMSQPQGNLFVRFAVYVVIKTLRKSLEYVTFDRTAFEKAVRDVPEGAHIVLVPSHRSYLDFVLCSILMFARPELGIRIPHIAATSDFARIPLLNWLILRLHAFYIERGLGQEDKRLTNKVRRLVRSGRVIEFFIEGKRSRARRFLPPRRGLLRCLQSTGETFAVLPIAFSYERLPEEAPFTAELKGDPRPPMRLRDLIRWNRRARAGDVRLGRAHIGCGKPVVYGPDSDIYEVAKDIMAELQYETVATRYHLLAFLEREKDALVDIDMAWLAQAIERRGGSVLRTYLDDRGVSPLHERGMRYQYEHLFYAEAEQAFAGNPAIRSHIRRNRYGEFATPDNGTAQQDPRVLLFLRALFGDVVRNYRVVIDALGDPAVPLRLNTPLAVVRARLDDELHVPDVEAVFNDLASRHILDCDKEEKTYFWGTNAAELDGYRAALARF